MKLAEALITRADMQKKIAQVRARMMQNVKVQEGEDPAEAIEELLPLYDEMLAEFETIVKRINRTNGTTVIGGGTITDAIAERECLRKKITVYRDLYDAAAITQERYSRTEIKYVRRIDPVELQKNIDRLSKQYRELDTKIQMANWTTELAE